MVCGCDPVFPVYLTSRAAEQGYTPEWVVAGVALTDTDIVGQLFQQSEWSHAFGVTFNGPTLPKQNTFGYAAYKQVNPGSEPANAVDIIYAQMYEMAIGIEMAGPDLTPQNFENGMRAYPGSTAGASNALYGTWQFPTGHFTPQTDWSFIYWNPTKTSPYNDKTGQLRGLDDAEQDRLLRRRGAAAAVELPDRAAERRVGRQCASTSLPPSATPGPARRRGCAAPC